MKWTINSKNAIKRTQYKNIQQLIVQCSQIDYLASDNHHSHQYTVQLVIFCLFYNVKQQEPSWMKRSSIETDIRPWTTNIMKLMTMHTRKSSWRDGRLISCATGGMVSRLWEKAMTERYLYSLQTNKLHFVYLFFTARCTLVQSAVLRSHVVCLSVRLSVCNVGGLWSHRLEFFRNNFTIN